MAPRKRYTCLDLFAGAGGFSLGLEAGGFESVGAIEIDEVAGSSYRKNFGDRPVSFLGESGDLREVSALEIRERLEGAGVEELDLLAASPPCQGFSRVGRGKLDSMASQRGAFAEDERNNLYLQAIIMLKVLRPRVFIFENVAGILHLRGQNVAEEVCEAVADCGYQVRCALLNAAWYGVPQTRERIFILGTRDDLEIEPRFPLRRHEVLQASGTLSERSWRNTEVLVRPDEVPLARRLSPAVTVQDAFDDLPSFTLHLKSLRNGHRYRSLRNLFESVDYRHSPQNEFCQRMRSWFRKFRSREVTDHFCRWTPRDFETFARMKPGDLYPKAAEIARRRYREALEAWRKHGVPCPDETKFVPPYSLDNFPHKWRKLNPEEPSHTVTAHLSRDTYSHIHHDSRQARTITPREAARLQSFPDAFAFEGNTGDVYRQIGNAVPPLLAREIGKTIRQLLRKVEPEV